MFLFLTLILFVPDLNGADIEVPTGPGVVYCLVQPNCTNVMCNIPTCSKEESLVTQPCNCCPTCQVVPESGCPSNACQTVKCSQEVKCPKGQIQTWGGYCGCCAVCREYIVGPPCTSRPCPRIGCEKGYSPKIVKGCCYSCVKDC